MLGTIDRRGEIGYNEYKGNDPVLPIRSYTERMFIMVVTKQSVIGDVLDYDVETAQFFFAIGMHCLGCPSARGESIEDACAVHGTDADQLVEQINQFLAAKKG